MTGETQLEAGGWRMLFEAEGGALRYLRWHGVEVLRGVYAAVRDANWGTVLPEMGNWNVSIEADQFEIGFTARCLAGSQRFVWHGRIVGEADGRLTYAFDGTAETEFVRNRIGFCVLHAADCAGRPVRVERVDGTVEGGQFPETISPHQPFFEVRALVHEPVAGCQVTVRMEGDTFEMEDQRNWTDASFKTYCTPLAQPFPVRLEPGSQVKQRIEVALKGIPPAARRPVDPNVVRLEFDTSAAPRRLPEIGLVTTETRWGSLDSEEVDRLRSMRPAHLRWDCDPTQPGWNEAGLAAAREAKQVGAALEIALHLSDAAEDELRAVRDAARAWREDAWLARWLIFKKGEKSTQRAWVEMAREVFPGENVGSGTNAYFTELNRGRPPAEVLDGVCFSVNPQVHAFDDRSLAETLEMIGVVVRDAAGFSGRPVWVTPITLRPRFNPNATTAEPAPAAGALPATADVRQAEPFGAVWTLGALKYASEAGAASVTLYGTKGWHGVMEVATGSPAGERFPSKAGVPYPLFYVLQAVGSFGGATVVPMTSTDALRAIGLSLQLGARHRLLVANVFRDPGEVEVKAEGAWRGLLGECETLGVDRIRLGGYAVAVSDWETR